MIALVSSIRDIAGMNIRDSFLENFKPAREIARLEGNPVFLNSTIYPENVILLTSKRELINLEHYEEEIRRFSDERGLGALSFIVFLSRHSSAKGVPTLSAHATGNPGDALLGGAPRRLSVAPACLIKRFLNTIKGLKDMGNLNEFEVVQEATHHGPLLDSPSLFVEVGSTEKEWRRKDASQLMANALHKFLASLKGDYLTNCASSLAIGGLHTLPSFKRVIFNSGYGIGHAFPKYALADVDKGMILQAIERTVPAPGTIILDWKGMGGEKNRLLAVLEEVKVERDVQLLKTREFREKHI